ncbi:putative siderophore transport system permease protein YfiZ precursor [Nocardioides dokdonensis FR1436]|uniref:Putative siderophore transport system permease protein YfiZ n=1 Tax=Nocardioides dokdonensis FR1436 TaxID=1300347 RepID=A0A1A9GQU7_9ACTN|nr:iron ABC transporter permease [Nocardioides dokdonensis]ANH40030.1 putative siderophore transport system permease protein YfiZ precursor [Nocardioides dokdonensis FR1436]
MTTVAEIATTEPVREAVPGRPPSRMVPLGVVVALLVAACGSVLIGSLPVPPAAVLDGDHAQHAIAMARLDRTILGIVVGAALGAAGACLQGLTRNPLADPGILGINAGAAMAMVVAMALLGLGSVTAFVWVAFLGAAGAMVVVHGIAACGRDGATPGRLTIAGAAVTAVLTSLVSAVLLLDRRTMESFRYWQVGTLGGRQLQVVLDALPVLVLGMVLAIAASRRLDALALGDDVAAGLGASVRRSRLAIGLAATLLAGGATALAGPIGFVGLLVPHTARLVVGPAHAKVLPLSAALGAVLLLVADTLGRVVLPPSEVQVGIMTSLVGLPVFVWLLRGPRGAAR